MLRGIIMVALAALVLLAHVEASGAQGALVPVKFAEGSRQFNGLPFYTGIANGYFAAEGLAPELVTLKGGPAAASALVTGDVDVAFTVVESAIKLRQQGKELSVGAVLQDKNPCVVVVSTDSAAKTIQDLKDQTIGVTATGSLTDLLLRAYIRNQGLSVADYKIVAFGTPATINLAFEHGEIHAGVTSTPFLTDLQMRKAAKVMLDWRSEIYLGQSMLVRTEDLKSDKRAVLEKVYRGLKKAMNALYQDPLATAKAVKDFFPNVDESLLGMALTDDTREHEMYTRDLAVTPDAFDKWQKSLIANQVLSAGISYDDLFVKW